MNNFPDDSVLVEINRYLLSLPENKQADFRCLLEIFEELFPHGPRWFLDGRDSNGKVVANPNVGYGKIWLERKSMEAREFYQLGVSSTSTGFSIYFMGLKNNKVLSSFATSLGKVTVTGYCIKFKKIEDLDRRGLTDMIKQVVNLRTI